MKRLYVFPERCTGCRECSLACSLVKFGTCNPKRSAIRIIRDEFRRYEYQIVCQQCEDPQCLEHCPQDAYSIQDGIVVLNGERCTVCGICVDQCPYDAVIEHEGTIIKCDLCGGDPMCVKYCTTGAVQYLEETKELEDHRQAVNEMIKEI